MSVDLRQTILGAEFQNPVLLASGTAGYGAELDGIVDLESLGGIVTKAVTPEVRAGNPAPRVAEFAAGMINSVGLANVGLDEFRSQKLPWLASRLTRARVLVNVAGKTVEDFVAVVSALDGQRGFSAFANLLGRGVLDREARLEAVGDRQEALRERFNGEAARLGHFLFRPAARVLHVRLSAQELLGELEVLGAQLLELGHRVAQMGFVRRGRGLGFFGADGRGFGHRGRSCRACLWGRRAAAADVLRAGSPVQRGFDLGGRLVCHCGCSDACALEAARDLGAG